MKVNVTIKCRGCGWAEVIEVRREMEAGEIRLGAVHVDGHKLMCQSCNSTVYDVVSVDARS